MDLDAGSPYRVKLTVANPVFCDTLLSIIHHEFINMTVKWHYKTDKVVEQFLKWNTYSPGHTDVNVTGLIAPPQIGALKTLYKDKIVRDDRNAWPAAIGSVVHMGLERIGKNYKDYLVEEFLTTVDKGVTWGGHIDAQVTTPDGLIIRDYKTTKVFKVKKLMYGYDDADRDWETQLNLYALLVKRNKPDTKIAGIEVLVLFSDFSLPTAEEGGDYPERSVMTLQFPLWTLKQQEEYVHSRLDLWAHQQQAMDLHEEFIPCTDEERWKKPDVFKVMSKSTHRSRRNFTNEKDAEAFVKSQADPEKFYIQTTRGLPLRCRLFCDVAPFCKQYQNELNEGEN